MVFVGGNIYEQGQMVHKHLFMTGKKETFDLM